MTREYIYEDDGPRRRSTIPDYVYEDDRPRRSSSERRHHALRDLDGGLRYRRSFDHDRRRGGSDVVKEKGYIVEDDRPRHRRRWDGDGWVGESDMVYREAPLFNEFGHHRRPHHRSPGGGRGDAGVVTVADTTRYEGHGGRHHHGSDVRSDRDVRSGAISGRERELEKEIIEEKKEKRHWHEWKKEHEREERMKKAGFSGHGNMYHNGAWVGFETLGMVVENM